jgi:hypothetical protein
VIETVIESARHRSAVEEAGDPGCGSRHFPGLFFNARSSFCRGSLSDQVISIPRQGAKKKEPQRKRDSTAPRSGVCWNRLIAGEPPFG